AKNKDLARQFVEFMLSPDAQKEIPLGNYMYPAVPSTPLPEAFKQTPMPSSAVPGVSDGAKWLRLWEEVFSPQ
ncbi:MAG: thiamine ABC transporter substrate-binding protein, partial [Candidatus Micrarchaeota archaeon]